MVEFTYPVYPITNPLTFRASAVLPNAGAWDATPTEIAVPSHSRLTLYIVYTRGAAGGAVDFQLQFAPRSGDIPVLEDWFMGSLYSPAVLAAGVDSQSRIQREYITYQSTAAGAENFVYGPVEIDATVERVRIRCRESGVVGTPGTVHIVGICYSVQ